MSAGAGFKAIVGGSSVLGMGASESEAWADAEPRGLGSLLDARCADATHAALAAWEDEDPDPDHLPTVYLGEDGIVRAQDEDDHRGDDPTDEANAPAPRPRTCGACGATDRPLLQDPYGGGLVCPPCWEPPPRGL